MTYLLISSCILLMTFLTTIKAQSTPQYNYNTTSIAEKWKKKHALLVEEFLKVLSENDQEKQKKLTARYTSPAIVTQCFFDVFQTFLKYCCAAFKVGHRGGTRYPIPNPRQVTREDAIKVAFWASRFHYYVEFRSLFYRACEAFWLTTEEISNHIKKTCMENQSLRA